MPNSKKVYIVLRPFFPDKIKCIIASSSSSFVGFAFTVSNPVNIPLWPVVSLQIKKIICTRKDIFTLVL